MKFLADVNIDRRALQAIRTYQDRLSQRISAIYRDHIEQESIPNSSS